MLYVLVLPGVVEIKLKEKMNNKPERRNFARFPVEFALEVFAEDVAGNKYKDRAVLKNISGEGAMFMSKLAGKYFPGQLLETKIYLPGTDDVKALMRANATVIRIDASNNSGSDEKSEEIGIAIRFDTPMHFERLDIKTG